MHQELENLVNNILSKGELTDRSRELLMKKAEQLGVDAIDFELELEGRIAETKTRTSAPPPPIQSNKEGTIKKCPACGAVADSFSTNCKECGHEFRATMINNAIKVFSEKYEEIQIQIANEFREKPPKMSSGRELPSIVVNLQIEEQINIRRADLVTSYPITNTKEDILEFLALSIPEVKKKLGWTDQAHKKNLQKAWKAKCEQIIMKARFSMKDDKKTLEEIEVYAKQLGI